MTPTRSTSSRRPAASAVAERVVSLGLPSRVAVRLAPRRTGSYRRGMAPPLDDRRLAKSGRVRPAAASGTEPRTRTLRDRLEQDRLRHRVARLERVVVALRSRARAYDQPPDELRLALADFQEQLDEARARIGDGRTAANVARPSRDIRL